MIRIKKNIDVSALKKNIKINKKNIFNKEWKQHFKQKEKY